jgi:hypothetical protein
MIIGPDISSDYLSIGQGFVTHTTNYIIIENTWLFKFTYDSGAIPEHGSPACQRSIY